MTTKRKKLKRKFCIFIFIETSALLLSMFAWGFLGKVGAVHFKYIVATFSQSQKNQLSDALNFYYDNGLAKYTKGLILKCKPETESILKQFSWFHRNSLSYYLNDTPPYHEIVINTADYFDLLKAGDVDNFGTERIESKIIYWNDDQQSNTSTDKDKTDLLLSLVDVGTSILIGGSTPIGLGVSALNLLSKADSDPAKCVPAIVVFNKLRAINFSWTMGVLSLINFIFLILTCRRN